jgi:hypothetical protein
MIIPNFIAGVIALSIGVNAGPCRPTSAATSGTTTVETSATNDETSLATSTVLSTSGLYFTTDLTTFLTLSETGTTSAATSTMSAFVPADLFPCVVAEDCLVYTQLCDSIRCGCVQAQCVQIIDTTTATSEATFTAEDTTTADVATTTEAAPSN